MATILIVDDEPFQRILIRETLASNSLLSFMEAADGIQALNLVHTHRPDLILLDVMMPNVDGLTVCRLIKSDPALQGIYVTLVTSLDSPQDRANGVAAGADDYLHKPYDEKDLWNSVNHALRLTS